MRTEFLFWGSGDDDDGGGGGAAKVPVDKVFQFKVNLKINQIL